MRPSCGWCACAAAALVVSGAASQADETDQFMAWGVTLEDAAPVLNAYLNDQITAYIEHRNDAIEPPCSCEDLTLEIFNHVFKSRWTARFKDFVRDTDDIDFYPPKEVSNYRYMNLSIYRGFTFPYILPMSRTVRVGDVYVGTDKFGHMLGFGKRYYKRYLRHVRYGMDKDEAIDEVVRHGVFVENTIVGKLVDGIFSHADLEANYQGFLLARGFCEGEHPYLDRTDGRWRLTRPVDLRDYVTPYLDESYNPCHFWGRRKSLVLPILREEYAPLAHSEEVIDRFRTYDETPPSRSVEIIHDYFLKEGRVPQRDQVFAALGLKPGYPIDALAQLPVP